MSSPIKLTRPEPADPTRLQAAVFWAKIQANRVRRSAKNLSAPVARLTTGDPRNFPVVLAESRTPLWSETDPRERRLQLGKVHNLRLAAKGLDQVVVPSGATLSFWSQVGKPAGARGYVEGRQIQEGCVVPAIAGGVCQLSNALYSLALECGFEVTERHPHTRALPNGAWSAGRDATVAWNHIDLRFRACTESMLRVRLSSDELVVQFLGRAPVQTKESHVEAAMQESIESCETCGMSQCWRHKGFDHASVGAKTAWVLDQVWPEYAEYLGETRGKDDSLLLVLDGEKRKAQRYAWPTGGLATIEAKWIALRRSLASRRLSEQGAERQRSSLAFDQRLALHFAKKLRFDVPHVVVAQNLLPFLWSSGALGGRTFDVLMTRRPMHDLQRVLDEQFHLHPERRLLADFRAPDEVVQAEREALVCASKVVTPHHEIAAIFGERAVLLDWSLPKAKGAVRGDRIAFPGPTVSRKGAYELRDAAKKLGLKLRLCGSELEGPGFWKGLDVDRAAGDWLDGCCAVVQPAVLEDQPRKLLRAIAEGVPVIATAACGVSHLPGVTTVPVADSDALVRALRSRG